VKSIQYFREFLEISDQENNQKQINAGNYFAAG